MYCQNRISYRVQEGDSLYKIAKQFHTTVTELILLNAGVNPYNLQIGMRLTVCPGEGYEDNRQPVPPVSSSPSRPGNNQSNRPGNNQPNRPGNNMPQPDTGLGNTFRERMRMAWLNHIMLVKFYLISFFDNLSSQNAWKDAVGQNAEEILSLFAEVYPPTVMQQLTNLFLEHLKLTDEVAADLKADPTATGPAMMNWYTNAENMAAFLSRQNPAFNEDELRKALYDHLDMERQQMEAYLDGDYKTDIDIFLRSQKKIIELADMLASGLMAR